MVMLGVTALVGVSLFLTGMWIWLDRQGPEDERAGTAARSVTFSGVILAASGGVMLSIQ